MSLKNCKIPDEDAMIVLDVLDLDEDVVDNKLEKLIQRKEISLTQLRAILICLKYKYLICKQEETDCDNDIYVNFALKSLINSQNEEKKSELLLNILTISILLNEDKIENFVQHVIQQLLSSEELQAILKSNSSETSSTHLQIVNNVLELCVSHGISLFPLFINCEFEKILQKQDEIVNLQFYFHTIPMVMKICRDYSILNMIWDSIVSRVKSNTKCDFSILVTLSEYYLPLEADGNVKSVESSMVENSEFWEVIQYGLLHDDFLIRKCSIYLAKRAVLLCDEKGSKIANENSIFHWKKNEKQTSKWDSLFNLLETLEEKQSELVLSALKLFQSIELNLHHSWYNIAAVRSLSHNTNVVVFESIKIVLAKNNIEKGVPYCKLLDALNNTYMFEYFDKTEVNPLKILLKRFLLNEKVLLNIMREMAKIKLSPIPKYFIFSVISEIVIEDLKDVDLPNILIFFETQDITSNNALIDYSVKGFFLDFIINHKLIKDIEDLLNVIERVNTVNTPIHMGNILWKQISKLLNNCNKSATDLEVWKFWEENVLLKSNKKSFYLLFLLMVSTHETRRSKLENVMQTLTAVLNCNENEMENELHYHWMVSIATIIDEVHNVDEDLKNKVINFLHQNNLQLIYYILGKLSQRNNLSEDLFRCLKIFIFNSSDSFVDKNYDQIVDKTVYLFSHNNGNIELKYCGLKFVSYFLQFIYKNVSWSNERKYDLIKPLFDIVIESNITKTRFFENGIELSKIFKEFIIIYTIHYKLLNDWNSEIIIKIHTDILKFLEIGGNGCLLPILDLACIILPKLPNTVDFDEVKILIDSVWKEIFVIRKCSQFYNCLSAFIKLIYQNDILNNSMMNDVILDYTEKTFEFGKQVPSVVDEFMQQLDSETQGEFILKDFVIKATIFGSPLRKDQRIEKEIINKILSTNRSSLKGFEKQFRDPIPHIRMKAMSLLIKQNVVGNLINELDSLYNPKNRYHGNSLHHRMLLRTLQFLCISSTIHRDVKIMDWCVAWCVQRLQSQPHHASSKTLLEWYISLYIVYKDISLNETNMKSLNVNNIPQISYFTILFQVLKHRLKNIKDSKGKDVCDNVKIKEDLEFVLQLLSPYTMGQIFNIRLHAQYYVVTLLNIIKESSLYSYYSLIVDTINRTFDVNKTDINLRRIQQDFYINDVDIVKSLTLNNIFNILPRLMNVAQDEWIPLDIINEYRCNFPILLSSNDDILESRFLVVEENNKKTNVSAADMDVTIVQKKFVPWQKILSDIGVNTEQEKNVQSDLVVVASLIDRLPNLGGLSRTCEVFGVKAYVIGSRQCLQDKQFQSTSMSSEKWLNIVEKNPGHNLKEYLMEMKANGYAIVGAEQTSSSIPLNSFVFPKKTLLLVGHEKDGIPCDLISLMDHCVEIKQYGMIRSLNVHVTASIFIWEYMKQNFPS